MRTITVAAAALATVFMMATPSRTEMRITPDGVTTPNYSARLRLSGSFSGTGSFSAVVSAYNTSTSDGETSGGYFSVYGPMGIGVYGEATYAGESNQNLGGYFRADGGEGMGVYARAIGTKGRGVYANASGSSGRGVYAEALGSSGIGVYAEALGSSGKGVYGEAEGTPDTNSEHYGGHFIANGQKGRGAKGEASGTNGIGVFGQATGSNSTGVWAEGKLWDFYANGEGGNYGAFTGAHEVKLAEEMPRDIAPGMIVSATGKTEIRRDKKGDISLSSTLPTVTLSVTARDKSVLGVLVSEAPHPQEHWYEALEGERFGVVNALGEGRVWVTDQSGEIEAGDYITSSEIPGYGQRQADDLLHSYTLGKAIETIDWNQVTETVQHEGKTYRRYLLAVVYTSG